MTEMGKTLLAIDVGGSTSRACLIDETGRCLGRGRNLGGNPASNTPEQAASAIISAVETAVAEAGLEQPDIAIALIALAGPQKHVALAKLETAFRAVGLTGPIVFVGDVQAMFSSVTATTEGYCVIAGTGAGAVRIRGGQVERVVDLAGWLAGDLGSGFWLGQQAARAAVADLEGRGERTALTAALLAAFNIPWSGERIVDASPAKRLSALMLTCGTYDAAGDFVYRVGLPAKSGVGGGIVAVLPGEFGVCVWSPGLDVSGNSLAGLQALEWLTTLSGRSIF